MPHISIPTGNPASSNLTQSKLKEMDEFSAQMMLHTKNLSSEIRATRNSISALEQKLALEKLAPKPELPFDGWLEAINLLGSGYESRPQVRKAAQALERAELKLDRLNAQKLALDQPIKIAKMSRLIERLELSGGQAKDLRSRRSDAIQNLALMTNFNIANTPSVASTVGTAIAQLITPLSEAGKAFIAHSKEYWHDPLTIPCADSAPTRQTNPAPWTVGNTHRAPTVPSLLAGLKKDLSGPVIDRTRTTPKQDENRWRSSVGELRNLRSRCTAFLYEPKHQGNSEDWGNPPAYLITAAHCGQSDHTAVASSRPVNATFTITLANREKPLRLKAPEIYYTNGDTDLAVVKLTSSLRYVLNKGVQALPLSDESPTDGANITTIGFPRNREHGNPLEISTCEVHLLKKQSNWEDGIDTISECKRLGPGASGGPMIEKEVVAIHVSGSGLADDESRKNYGVATRGLNQCFQNGRLDTAQPGCTVLPTYNTLTNQPRKSPEPLIENSGARWNVKIESSAPFVRWKTATQRTDCYVAGGYRQHIAQPPTLLDLEMGPGAGDHYLCILPVPDERKPTDKNLGEALFIKRTLQPAPAAEISTPMTSTTGTSEPTTATTTTTTTTETPQPSTSPNPDSTLSATSNEWAQAYVESFANGTFQPGHQRLIIEWINRLPDFPANVVIRVYDAHGAIQAQFPGSKLDYPYPLNIVSYRNGEYAFWDGRLDASGNPRLAPVADPESLLASIVIKLWPSNAAGRETIVADVRNRLIKLIDDRRADVLAHLQSGDVRATYWS